MDRMDACVRLPGNAWTACQSITIQMEPGRLGGCNMGFSASAYCNKLRWHLLLRPLGITILPRGTVLGSVPSRTVVVSFRLSSDAALAKCMLLT